MKSMNIKSLLTISAMALLSATASAQIVKIDGSSTVFPLTEGVAEDFQKSNKGLKVTVGVSGTGGGFKKFCRGETDFSNASRPILKQEMEACKAAGVEYIELPAAYDALTVVINPRNTWLQSATVAELKKMWEPAAQGKITRWNQVNPAWPDQPMKLFGAGSDSGTFDYFTEAIVGKAKSSRGDYTASEDDNVLVQGVAGDVNAIGYFGYAYYAENAGKLKALPIIEKDGKPAVSPNEETVLNGSYQPLARPIYIYVNVKSLAKPEVKKFAEYFLSNASRIAKEVKYVPLPADYYKAGLNRLNKGEKGTVFGGHADVGVTVKDLFKRTPAL
ncbi:MAG: PstS family phosphate ABC transporter substrate-binding protein [Hylemonella sp.]|uniref:PstS family phosphate ABC transporter substrate-binding protein n=1 Tax=Hylemonella sp. TaxID=2066020 RepID=UPI00391A6FC5